MKEEVGTILVSAHPDDVALSVGGSILAGFFARPLLLVSVFSYGGTAPFYSGKHDVETLNQVRDAEDAAFARAVGSRLYHMDMKDAILNSARGEFFEPLRWVASVVRGPPPANDSLLESQIMKLTLRVPRSLKWQFMESLTKLDATYIDLKRRLSQLFSYYPNAWVAAPLSLGLHPDHVLVSTACKSLPLRDRVFFYEDLPYSMAYRLDGIRRHVTRFDSDLRPVWVDVEGEVGRKLKNLRLYGSQLGPVDLDRTIGHSRRLKKDGRAYERIWTYQTSGIWPSQRTPPAVLA